MIYLCDCGKFHENYPCLLCDDCLNTADGKLWEKLTPKAAFVKEADAAHGDDDFMFEADDYSCWYCGWPGCDSDCVDAQLPSHETGEHLEIT